MDYVKQGETLLSWVLVTVHLYSVYPGWQPGRGQLLSVASLCAVPHGSHQSTPHDL